MSIFIDKRLEGELRGRTCTTRWKYVKYKRQDILRAMVKRIRMEANDFITPIKFNIVTAEREAGYACPLNEGPTHYKELSKEPVPESEMISLFGLTNRQIGDNLVL